MPSFKDVFNRQLCQRNLAFALAFANGCSYYGYRNLCSCTVDLDGGGMYIAEYQTGLIGTLTLGADERGLVGCWFENGRFYLGGVDEPLVRDASFPALRQAAAWLERYFAGEKPPVPELVLAPRGPPSSVRCGRRLRIYRTGRSLPTATLLHGWRWRWAGGRRRGLSGERWVVIPWG